MQEDLQNLGFSQNEATIYLTLTERGAIGTTELAKATGLNRSYLYDALERMREKGYISDVTGRGNLVQAASPGRLHEQFQLKADELRRLLPALEAIHEGKEDTQVELHRGKQVFRTLTADMLRVCRTDAEILIISADEEAFVREDATGVNQYYRQLKENGGCERILIKRGSYRFNQPMTSYRELPPSMIGNSSILIYGNRVAEIVFGRPHYVVITRNAEMAAARRKLFEHLWREADEISG